MKDLLFGALAGDMEDLSFLFLLMLPIFLVVAAIAAAKDKMSK